jgi:hypothetical protein
MLCSNTSIRICVMGKLWEKKKLQYKQNAMQNKGELERQIKQTSPRKPNLSANPSSQLDLQ